MVATIKDPMDDNMDEGSNSGDEISEEENMDTEGFETVNRSGKVQEPDFNDPEGFVDDVDDEVLMADLIRQKPKESDGMDSVIVVDGIPSVSSERLDKLKGVVRKIYGKVATVINEHYPVNEKGETKGYCFLEFPSHGDAVEAVKTTQNYKLDKSHTFLVNLFSDFEKYENIPEEWEPPVEEPFVDQGSRKSHLLEPDACDQYALVYKGGEEVAVHQNSVRGAGDPKELQVRSRWTETYVKWSPLGSYLATCHRMGIALWGGEDFRKMARFSHEGVQFFDFSPCENYLVTFSPNAPVNRQLDEPNAIIIWETRTGVKKRSFNADMHGAPHWPIFKWSHNDKYFGRMTKDGALSVYETPSFGLLDKKSIKVSGMRDFSWSPSNNTLAYWVAEDKDVPARVVLLELPSRNEIRVKNLFNVANCKMHWQKSGDYLCVKVDRYSKLRKEKEENKYAGLYCNFEVFHMREKQIPVDSVEIKENVHAFAWEPIGSKFAIIHGEMQSLNVSFYEVKTGQTPTLKKKYERKTANMLFWSPQGQFIVLAGLRNMNGVLECIDTADFTSMNSGEHFMCTDVEWDATGRYFMTAVSWWGHKVDNGYWLWSFQGKILKRIQLDRFCQLLWRPRPPTLLAQKDIKEIKKNLKKYSVEFDVVDREQGSKKSKELLTKRRNFYEEYMVYRKLKEQEFNEQKEQRISLRNGVDTDIIDADNNDMEEEVVEFLVSEEVVSLE